MDAARSPDQQIMRSPDQGNCPAFTSSAFFGSSAYLDLTAPDKYLAAQTPTGGRKKIVAKFVEVQELRDLAWILIHSDTLR
jgi:hypothetical protein